MLNQRFMLTWWAVVVGYEGMGIMNSLIRGQFVVTGLYVLLLALAISFLVYNYRRTPQGTAIRLSIRAERRLRNQAK